MRLFVAGALLLLTGCGPGLVFNSSDMSPKEMEARANLIFVGVIRKHSFESWPFVRLGPPGVSADQAQCWKILRREVTVETVLRGRESRKTIDVYEIFWICGASGDWNATTNGDRALFLVRLENGHYHVVRDWWRSIFLVRGGAHPRAPFDNSHSVWERFALMAWWFNRCDADLGHSRRSVHRSNPADALSDWRVAKLERGLLRHPSSSVRLSACEGLIRAGLDDCWEMLSPADKAEVERGQYTCCSANAIAAARRRLLEHDASWWWNLNPDPESRRLLTTVHDRKRRTEFCRLWARDYPGDTDAGCPADRPPPATIVRQQGDIPLVGLWPEDDEPHAPSR